MRFWWPDWQPRERSPSSDSECSTASHSSLASDASFYSAAGDGAGAAAQATARAGADPLGLGLRIVDPPAPVLGSAEPETDPADPPRALPLLGTGAAAGAATSGTGPGPAAPIARQPAAGLEPAGDQASPRSSSATSRRFEDRTAGGRSTLPSARSDRAPSHPASPPGRPAGPGLAAAAAHAASDAAPTPQARRSASSAASPAAPPLRAPQLPPSDVGRPGRAAGRLPDLVAPGAALAAATARALAVCHGPSDPDDDASSDEDDSAGPAAAGSGPQDPSSVLPRPGRAGGMLPAGRALAAPPARAPAATPTAPQHPDDPGAGTDA
ncbi:hypothetical protein PR003_g32671, partial [Phytophthora rubi]